MRLTFKEIMEFSPENQKVFDELKVLCTRGLIVPYVGAGLSYFAGFPTWDSFINTYKKDIKNPDNLNNIELADLIEQELDKEKIHTTFGGNLSENKWLEICNKAEFQNEAVSYIPKLFSSPIITTNFDKILEKIFKNKKSEIPVAFPNNTEELEKVIDKREQLIYKIHGCVSDPQNIVLAKRKYDEVYSSDSPLVNSLSKFCQGFHFLFLGCSIILNQKEGTKDYSIDLLEKIQKKSEMPHYAIIECKENATEDEIKARRKELENNHIFPILYKHKCYDSVKIILDAIYNEYRKQLFQIPNYKLPFVERKDVIAKIENELNNEKWAAIALKGIGGVGKTRILSEYATREKKESKYTDIVWFNAISEASIREEIRNFLINRGLNIDEKDPYRTPSVVFRQWMQNYENWLFLLDNVEHYEDISIFFDFDKTLAGKRHILMSSRLETDKFPNISIIEVNTFTLEEARVFLQSRTGKEPDEYTDKIADKYNLGGLPLALEQAAAYIKKENISYQSYLEKLEEALIDVLEEQHPELGVVSVRATWNISMQRIKKESAKQLLYLCAYFAPDNIHSEWFVGAADVLPDELKKDVQNEIDFTEIKKELKAYSLVKIDDNGRISMHRLLQGVVRKRLEEEQDKWVKYCMFVLNKHYFNDFSTADSRMRFTSLAPHIEFVNNFIDYDKASAEILILLLAAIHYSFLGDGFYNFADYSQSLKWYTKSLASYEKIFSKENSFAASIYNNMSMVYCAQGNYDKALGISNNALAIHEKEFDKDHLDIAIIYSNMASAYYYQGDYDKALGFNNKVLVIREKELGKEHSSTAKAYDNIGLVYCRQGDYNKALECHVKALAIFEKERGKEHIDTAIAYDNIALVYKNQGDYDKALEFNFKASIIFEKELGKEHPDIATNYNNIAMVYCAQGNYDKALEFYGKALAIDEKIFGKGHPDTAKTYKNMAEVYDMQSDYDKTLEFYGKALAINEKMLGKEHLNTATIYNNMAMIYHGKSYYDRALDFYAKALVVYEKMLGKEHLDTATIYNNIADIYHMQGNYYKALELYIKSYKIFLYKFGADHSDSKKCKQDMKIAYDSLGKTEEFENWLEGQGIN
jgi:tetratricopeptide (TPR) repeat protein